MEEPVKPRFYNLIQSVRFTIYVIVLTSIIRIDILENLLLSLGILVLWGLFNALIEFSSKPKHLLLFRKYREEIYAYQLLMHQNRKEAISKNGNNDLEVANNIIAYKIHLADLKANKKWWQFWI